MTSMPWWETSGDVDLPAGRHPPEMSPDPQDGLELAEKTGVVGELFG